MPRARSRSIPEPGVTASRRPSAESLLDRLFGGVHLRAVALRVDVHAVHARAPFDDEPRTLLPWSEGAPAQGGPLAEAG